MGLWKNVGIATCLQYDYGYGEAFARFRGNMMGQMDYLPGTQISTKSLNKYELAAWIATASCIAPEGENVNNPEYHRHVELTILDEHRRGKISVPMFRELESCFELLHDPELREAVFGYSLLESPYI